MDLRPSRDTHIAGKTRGLACATEHNEVGTSEAIAGETRGLASFGPFFLASLELRYA